MDVVYYKQDKGDAQTLYWDSRRGTNSFRRRNQWKQNHHSSRRFRRSQLRDLVKVWRVSFPVRYCRLMSRFSSAICVEASLVPVHIFVSVPVYRGMLSLDYGSETLHSRLSGFQKRRYTPMRLFLTWNLSMKDVMRYERTSRNIPESLAERRVSHAQFIFFWNDNWIKTAPGLSREFLFFYGCCGADTKSTLRMCLKVLKFYFCISPMPAFHACPTWSPMV